MEENIQLETTPIEDIDIGANDLAEKTEEVVNGIDINETIEPIFKNLDKNHYNFLELMVARKSLDEYKAMFDDVESAKTDLDGLYELIDEINSVNDTDLHIDKDGLDTTPDLLKDMEEYKKRILYTEEIVDSLLREYDSVDKDKASFITNQIIDSLKRQIINLEASNDINKEYKLAVLKQKLMAHENRTDISYMISKATFAPSIKTLAKEYKKNPTRGRRMVRRNMKGVFTEQSLMEFENYLLAFFDRKHITMVYQKIMIPELFIYYLAKFVRNEFKTGKYSYAKMLIANCIDISRGHYDLEKPIEEFENDLLLFICIYITGLTGIKIR